MHKIPLGFAIIILIIQLFVLLGDDSCGVNCVVDKEQLGITIFVNVMIIIGTVIYNIKNKEKDLF